METITTRTHLLRYGANWAQPSDLYTIWQFHQTCTRQLRKISRDQVARPTPAFLSKNRCIEDRGRFYDEIGALRDVVQNHMLQVVAHLTMDPPTGEDHDAVRHRKCDLMKAIRPLTVDSIVRGQYQGYQSVSGVASGSRVETFVALNLSIDSWRWADVPIYIRAGKKMPVTCTEAIVEFKRPPRETFGELVPSGSAHMRIRLGPDVMIGLGVRIKVPGECMLGRDVELELHRQAADNTHPYERLLDDASRGIKELFARQDVIEEQWRIVEPVLGNAALLYTYSPSTWGPDEAGQLIAKVGVWENPVVTSCSDG